MWKFILTGVALWLASGIGAEAQTPAKFRGVVVVVTKYSGGLPSMPGLAGAAQKMDGALRSLAARAGYGPASIEIDVITDLSASSSNRTASEAEIVKAVTRAAAQSNRGDTLVFFFTGHGGSNPGSNSSYLYTTGADDQIKANRIDLREQIVDVIRSRSLASVNLLLIDACQVPASGDALGGTQPLVSSVSALEALKSQGIATVLAARPGERAWVDPANGVGFFTNAVEESLRTPSVLTAQALVSRILQFLPARVERAFPNQQRTQNPILNVELSSGGTYSLLPRPIVVNAEGNRSTAASPAPLASVESKADQGERVGPTPVEGPSQQFLFWEPHQFRKQVNDMGTVRGLMLAVRTNFQGKSSLAISSHCHLTERRLLCSLVLSYKSWRISTKSALDVERLGCVERMKCRRQMDCEEPASMSLRMAMS